MASDKSDNTEYRIVKINDDGKDLSPNSEWGNINKLSEDGWEFHEVLGWNVNAGWGHLLFRRGGDRDKGSKKESSKS